MGNHATWEEVVFPLLDTPESAAAYLEEVLTLASEDNDPELFLSAMRDVIAARGGLPTMFKNTLNTTKYGHLDSFFRPMGLQPYV